jgi:hypothetical protein
MEKLHNADKKYLRYLLTSTYDSAGVLNTQLSYLIAHIDAYPESVDKELFGLVEDLKLTKQNLVKYTNVVRNKINKKSYGVAITKIIPFDKLKDYL